MTHVRHRAVLAIITCSSQLLHALTDASSMSQSHIDAWGASHHALADVSILTTV